MNDMVVAALFVVAWFTLQLFVLPKLGGPT